MSGNRELSVDNSVASSVFLGARGSLRFYTDANGFAIAYYIWPAASGKAKATICGVHGHGSHSRYEFLNTPKPGAPGEYKGSWVERLNKIGYAFVSVDLQGCGMSSGLRGFVNSWEDYVENVVQVGELIKATPMPGVNSSKLFLLGESMGGGLALDVIIRYPDMFEGAVLLAPMLSLEKLTKRGINKYIIHILNFLSWLVPTLPLAETAVCEKFPEIQACWDHDPLTYKDRGRARNAAEYLRVTHKLMRSFNKVKAPFLVFHSEGDNMTDPDGSKKLYKEAASDDKTLRLVNDMWHFLVKEPGSDKVLDEIVNWLDKRI